MNFNNIINILAFWLVRLEIAVRKTELDNDTFRDYTDQDALRHTHFLVTVVGFLCLVASHPLPGYSCWLPLPFSCRHKKLYFRRSHPRSFRWGLCFFVHRNIHYYYYFLEYRNPAPTFELSWEQRSVFTNCITDTNLFISPKTDPTTTMYAVYFKRVLLYCAIFFE